MVGQIILSIIAAIGVATCVAAILMIRTTHYKRYGAILGLVAGIALVFLSVNTMAGWIELQPNPKLVITGDAIAIENDEGYIQVKVENNGRRQATGCAAKVEIDGTEYHAYIPQVINAGDFQYISIVWAYMATAEPWKVYLMEPDGSHSQRLEDGDYSLTVRCTCAEGVKVKPYEFHLSVTLDDAPVLKANQTLR